MADNAKRDANRIPTLLGVSNVDGVSPVILYADPTTHRLLVSSNAGAGTVTSVAALTLGTTGTDLSSTVANGTTTPVITLNVPTASASNRGALSAADWTTFNAKASTTSPTFATSITGSYLTASEILITDADKKIVSAAVATYPSLTELSYVKGVTSAIQTQIGAKAPSASPTFTGTVVLPKTVEIQDTSADHQYVLAVSELTADRTVTLPLLTGNDEFTFNAHTQTLTNKRVNPRVISATSYTTDTGTSLNADNCDVFRVTAQAGALLFNAPGGTPTDGQKLIISVASSTTTARALTWNAIFEASTVALPTTTAATTAQLNIGFIYSTPRTKWVCVAVA